MSPQHLPRHLPGLRGTRRHHNTRHHNTTHTVTVSSLVMIFHNEDVTMFIIVYFVSILYNIHVYLFVYLFFVNVIL